jgi:hypothetical protein
MSERSRYPPPDAAAVGLLLLPTDPPELFVEEIWDTAIFTPHGIVRQRNLLERPRFDPAHAWAADYITASPEEEENPTV